MALPGAEPGAPTAYVALGDLGQVADLALGEAEEITWKSNDLVLCEEGCLSVPDLYEEVERPDRVRVKFLDYHGKPQEIECEGMLAVCIQHEMDHLEGILFIDHLSRLKRDMMLKKLAKSRKPAAQPVE